MTKRRHREIKENKTSEKIQNLAQVVKRKQGREKRKIARPQRKFRSDKEGAWGWGIGNKITNTQRNNLQQITKIEGMKKIIIISLDLRDKLDDVSKRKHGEKRNKTYEREKKREDCQQVPQEEARGKRKKNNQTSEKERELESEKKKKGKRQNINNVENLGNFYFSGL